MMNRPGGYFVVHPRLAWTAHVIRDRRLARPGDTWLLASDGLTRLTDLFGLYDASALRDAALTRGMKALLAELRGIENADAVGDRFVRVKRHDDATGLLVRVE